MTEHCTTTKRKYVKDKLEQTWWMGSTYFCPWID